MNEVLKVENMTKIYPNGVMANEGINFMAMEGEIHAICGENGAGKSTLMKILYGMEEASSGKIIIRGEEVKMTSSSDAIKHSIGMVHQHFMLVPSLTVAENVVLGMEPTKGVKLDMEEAIRLTEAVSEKYNLPVSATEKVENLSVALKQRVELIKALLKGADILILDEPTTVLTPQETTELFRELKNLRDQGHTILFISHKLNEVKELCDRISIMRAGKMIETVDADDVSEADISRKMVGRDVVEHVDKKEAEIGALVLETSNLSRFNAFGKKELDQVSLKVFAGEILGLAGIEGNGQHAFIETLAGMRKVQDGEIYFQEEAITHKSIREIRDMGVAHIPEDRMINGSAGEMSIAQNILAGNQRKEAYTSKLFLNNDYIRKIAEDLVEEYAVKCSNIDQNINMLSGGNIQKVVVAREFSSDPHLILIDQPTRGIDIGAAMFIRNRLVELRDEGKAIILNSADLNEVLELSDSLIVFHEGKIAAYFTDTTLLTEEELGLYMLGLKKQSQEEIEVLFNERV